MPGSLISNGLPAVGGDNQAILPEEAVQTKKVDDLARLSLRSPVYIGVDDISKEATVSGLE